MKILYNAIIGTTKITAYFTTENEGNVHSSPVEEVRDKYVVALDLLSDVMKIKITSNPSSGSLSVYDSLRYLAVRNYIMKLIEGNKKIVSSEATAKDIFPDKSIFSYGRNIRVWTEFYLMHLFIPPVIRGKHQKVKPLLCENDIKDICRSYLHSLPSGKVSVQNFKSFIEQELFPGRQVSESTVRIYLNDLGYKFQRHKNGMYVDGHEREDVRIYRDEFLKRMFTYEQFMEKYSGDDMNTVEFPTLLEGQKRHVLVVHDESLFYSNDDNSSLWVHPKHPPLRKKGKGKCIMLSEFLCECHGRLFWQTTTDEKEFATETITPGKNDDGWWTAEHLSMQFKAKAIPMFNYLHPDCVAVFLFDNSTNHGALANDALNVNKMNLGIGGKQAQLRAGWFLQDDVRIVHEMVFPSTHTQAGIPKGIKQVLLERNLWVPGMKLQDARALLAQQQDFIQQKSILEECAQESGHVVLFLPKFHCELNFIEMYWGALKYFCRNNCDYSFKNLLPTVYRAMDSITLATIRRFARKCWRYMDAYFQGLTVQQAEWAVRKQKSHRRVNMSLIPKD